MDDAQPERHPTELIIWVIDISVKAGEFAA